MLSRIPSVYEQRSVYLSNTDRQKISWAEDVKKHDWNIKETHGLNWGDPESSSHSLGNYLKVKNNLIGFVDKKRVLELGSLSGKWTKYMNEAQSVMCVDITQEGFENVKKYIPSASFYLTRGDELDGIDSESVDIIFCMDTLVRVPIESIEKYFLEFGRVLSRGGGIYVHLPYFGKVQSDIRFFTKIGDGDIVRFCRDSKLEIVEIDRKVIKHGVMLFAQKR